MVIDVVAPEPQILQRRHGRGRMLSQCVFWPDTQVDYEDYLLPPLAGVIVSLTGFDGQAKQRLARQIEGGGGCHSPELTQRCTHLVAASATGEKFK